jgi:translocator protein
MKPIIKLIISIAAPLLVGAASAYFTYPAVRGWYTTITKPSFNPPNYLFGPVWTTLYTMMGIACFIIWNSNANAQVKKKALAFYIIQLALNFSWSMFFFYLENPAAAFVIIILMLITIAGSIFWFKKISALAAWLLVPYICWVSFATALNFEIWRLNGLSS